MGVVMEGVKCLNCGRLFTTEENRPGQIQCLPCQRGDDPNLPDRETCAIQLEVKARYLDTVGRESHIAGDIFGAEAIEYKARIYRECAKFLRELE